MRPSSRGPGVVQDEHLARHHQPAASTLDTAHAAGAADLSTAAATAIPAIPALVPPIGSVGAPGGPAPEAVLMTPRGTELLRDQRAIFESLRELDKHEPTDVDAIVSAIVSHLQSWRPMSVAPLGQLPPPGIISDPRK
jgi:hypothetical protein